MSFLSAGDPATRRPKIPGWEGEGREGSQASEPEAGPAPCPASGRPSTCRAAVPKVGRSPETGGRHRPGVGTVRKWAGPAGGRACSLADGGCFGGAWPGQGSGRVTGAGDSVLIFIAVRAQLGHLLRTRHVLTLPASSQGFLPDPLGPWAANTSATRAKHPQHNDGNVS